MHVRRIEVVLFVPGRRRQRDVGINAGRRHAEIDRHQKVKLSFRRLLAPHHFFRFLTASFPKILALNAVIGSEQMFQEIFVPLSGRSQ